MIHRTDHRNITNITCVNLLVKGNVFRLVASGAAQSMEESDGDEGNGSPDAEWAPLKVRAITGTITGLTDC